MTGPGVVGLLVGGAVLLGTGSAAASRRVGRPAVSARDRATDPERAGVRVSRRGRRPDPTADLAAAVTAVAAEVRAGRAPGDAWALVLGVPAGPDGVPAVDDVVAAVAPVPGPVARRAADLLRGAGPGARGPGVALLRRRVGVVLAATRLATGLGAPLAGVLDGCARSLTEDADAETAVRAALAGPRQTTTLLTWLPVLGIGLGALLGADPVGVLLGGGLGTTAGVAGVLLTLAGRAWVGRMVRRARGDGPVAGGG